MTFTLTRPALPKIPRVYVTLRDAGTKQSETVTLYHTTKAELLDKLRREAAGNDSTVK